MRALLSFRVSSEVSHGSTVLTRLTKTHSKSQRHHKAMQAIYLCYYNFVRKHDSLNGQTPAMAARVTMKAWTIKELLERATEA